MNELLNGFLFCLSRQIWKAAHLRPLEKKEVDGFVGGGGKNAKVVWNNSSWAGGGGGESSCTGRKFIQQGGPHLSKEKPRDHGDESQVVSEGDKEAFNVNYQWGMRLVVV